MFDEKIKQAECPFCEYRERERKMNKCSECPFQYIDYRRNWKCRLNNKVVNAYGCEENLRDKVDEIYRKFKERKWGRQKK